MATIDREDAPFPTLGSERSMKLAERMRSSYSLRSLALLTVGLAVGSSITFMGLFIVRLSKDIPQTVQRQNQTPTKKAPSQSKVATSTISPSKTGSPRLLCWIPVSYKDKKLARSVKSTWSTRCDILLFIGDLEDDEIESLDLGVSDGEDEMWYKIKESLLHIYDRYRHEIDWAVKASADSYVVIDNLKAFLSNKNSSEAVYFGSKTNFLMNQASISSGAVYVLSIAALKLFKESGNNCWESEEGIDQTLHNCLLFVGVKEGMSKDSKGRSRFFPYSPESVLVPSYSELAMDNWENFMFAESADVVCCSDTSISFHKVNPTTMWIIEFFLYHMRIDGKCIEATPAPLEPFAKEEH